MVSINQRALANPYLPHLERLLDQQKRLAKSQIRLKYASTLALESEYLSQLSREKKKQTNKIKTKYQEYNEIEERLETSLQSTAVDSLKAIIKDQRQLDSILKHIEYEGFLLLNQIAQLQQVAKEQRDFCSHYPEQADVNNISLNPFNYKISEMGAYTEYQHAGGPTAFVDELNGGGMISGDPAIQDAANAAIGASFAAAMIYTLAEGKSLSTMLGNMVNLTEFSVSASIGGPAAASFLAATAVVVVVAAAWTAHENQERRKKAEKEYKRQLAEYQAAADSYAEGSID